MDVLSTLPDFIKLKEDRFGKFGVSKEASGEYKKNGMFYEATDAKPHVCNVSFSIEGVIRNQDDFDVIIKDILI